MSNAVNNLGLKHICTKGKHMPPPRSRRWGVILAGGEGTRLRHLTRFITGDNRPKQFCPVMGGETLLNQTRGRVALRIPRERILISLTRAHEPYYQYLKTEASDETLAEQPANLGTAPAISSCLFRISKKMADVSVAFFPSDHYISDDETFMTHVETAFRAVESQPDTIVLLGITPDYAETEYGWIEPVDPRLLKHPGVILEVRRFWEKPSAGLAHRLMSRGCLWNSFVMVGRVATFLRMIRRSLPGLYSAFASARDKIGTESEKRAFSRIYNQISAINFSEDVLAACPNNLLVLPVEDVIWSDWGKPSRVLNTISNMGIQTEWSIRLGLFPDNSSKELKAV